MSETFVPTPTEQNSACTMVEDGDPLTAASVRAGMEKLSNAVDKLEDKVFDAEVMTRHQWRPRPLSNCAIGPFTDALAGTSTEYKYGSVVPSTGTYFFECELDIAHGAELNQVRLYVYDGDNNDAVSATITVWKIDLDTTSDHGGDIHELPVATSLGSTTTYTHTTGESYGYFEATVGGTEIVDRSRYRYIAQVYSTDGASADRWFSSRVLTEGNTIDKAAG